MILGSLICIHDLDQFCGDLKSQNYTFFCESTFSISDRSDFAILVRSNVK